MRKKDPLRANIDLNTREMLLLDREGGSQSGFIQYLAQAVLEAEDGREHQAQPLNCTRQTRGGSHCGSHRHLDPNGSKCMDKKGSKFWTATIQLKQPISNWKIS